MPEIACERILTGIVRVRVEQLQVGTGRNDRHAVRIVEIVEFVLVFHLVVRAGNHQAGIGEGFLLGLYPARDIVALLDFLAFQSGGQQSQALVPAQ